MAGAYSSSKAAVIGVTKSIGKDVAESGVLDNCIAPAVINTPILEKLSQEHIDFMTTQSPSPASAKRARSRRRSAGSRARR